MDNFSQAAGVRFLLGVFEAGMMPGIAYYMSRWYRRAELTFRLVEFPSPDFRASMEKFAAEIAFPKEAMNA